MSTVRDAPAVGRAGSTFLTAPPTVPEASFEAAYASVAAELRDLMPSGGAVIDAHTHLGADEDGQSLTLDRLIEYLDEVDPRARAVVFPLHDPERRPAYRIPNDRTRRHARPLHDGCFSVLWAVRLGPGREFSTSLHSGRPCAVWRTEKVPAAQSKATDER